MADRDAGNRLVSPARYGCARKGNWGMAGTADFAEKWQALLLSTEPADRPAIEASIRSLYAAAEFGEPEHFLWYDSPLAAIWAVTALQQGRDPLLDGMISHVKRGAASRNIYEEARRDLCGRLGAADLPAAQKAAGRWFQSAFGDNRLAARFAHARFEFLDDAMGGAWMEHMSNPSVPGIDAVKADEERIFGRYGDGILGYGAAYSEAADIRHLMRTSMYGDEYSQLGCFGEVARDQHLAETSGKAPPPLIRAFWDVAAGAGPWWAFGKAVILAERPVEVQRRPDQSLVMVFRDGFTAEPYRQKPRARPKAEAKADRKQAPTVLKAKLPREHQARIAWLRRQAPNLPHFDRYLAGEHEQVWKDLVALGPKVRSEAHAADALAVAYETMHRVEHNVRTVAERLSGLGFRFVDPGRGGLLGALFGRRDHPAHVPPGSDTAKAIARLERRVHGPIPLALRAFYDVVGQVDLSGEHEAIAPRGSDFTPDPLIVYGVEDALGWLDGLDDEEEEDGTVIAIAPDALHKANISGGDPYMIRVPAALADAPVEEEPHDVTFVEYLRIAFRCGGFPGWEGANGATPPEISRLRDGLLPF